MKKIYLIIGVLFCCCHILMAQAPANRTAKTIVADVLAQMPADTQEKYNQSIKELIASGEEGVLTLVGMLNPPGKGTNASIDYALSGLSHYVMADGQEAARLATANAYLKALDRTKDAETKAFIIRQLQILGKNESVDKLASLLTDPYLGSPAARALAAIGSDKSGKALLSALTNAKDEKLKADIICAIGDMQMKGSEEALRALLGSNNENLQASVLYALSQVGTKASLSDLAVAANKANYTMEKTGANDAYITLIKRVLSMGDAKEAEKAANELLKNATTANQTHTRIAAIKIVLTIKKGSDPKLIMSAIKDPNIEYRNAALATISDFADKDTYTNILKELNKAKPEVKVDILNWLKRESDCPAKRDIIKGLRINGNQTLQQSLLADLKSNNFEVKQAAAWLLVNIGDKEAIAALANLLKSKDLATVSLGQETLASFSGDITPAVSLAITSASNAGKIAGLQLLAKRKSTASLDVVLAQINTGSPEVKAAAYIALRDVVLEKDLPNLYTMLESADASAIAPLQQAIISAISPQSKEQQVKTISQQMARAGESKKHLYYTVLASTGQAGALNTILDGFAKAEDAAKDAAFEALLSWKDIQAAEGLFAICENPKASAYFDRALDAYVKLIAKSGMTGENRLIYLRNAMEIAKTDSQKNAILQQIGRTNTFLGLMYAGDFLDVKPLQQSAANAVMNIALANKDYYGDNVEALLNKVLEVIDNPDAEYQRQAIRKYIAETPKMEGFVSIFNGKDLTGWEGLVSNPIARAKMKPAELAKAQIKADEIAQKHWIVEKDGVLMFDGTGSDNLCTVKQYGDIEMYVDWNLDPAGPEADAGIYLRGTPQVQMWDIARTNVGAEVGSGGLYNNVKNPSKPLKVADNKLGEWNTMYIKMVGDRVTVKLNGELVVDNVILENYWDRSQPIPPIEQIELQAHGSKVYYRNIYVKELERSEPFQLSAQEQKEGYKVLFDGTNMHAWTGNTVDYVMEDGVISLHPSQHFGGNLYTKDEFGNFVFRFEFQLTPAANNGLGIRTPMEGDAAYVGMELQILDNEDPVYKDLQPSQYHGSVYGVIAAKRGFLKPVGEWNYQEVVANGNHIKVILNGTVILDGDIKEASKNGTLDGKDHPGLFNKKGHIAFLGHGSPVKFRNIRIKELK